MELGVDELKMVFKKKSKGMFICSLLLLPMGHLSGCYISFQCNGRQEHLHFLVRDRNKSKIKNESKKY